ncbi:sugar phosphate isomerase/epimerase family protein [Methanoplanus endosymbiosus]|uniref:Sugar phosphate isomerase/epimerase n=1 Tax=Methanoplanus endosymbiosus TaxID=33865 RepID=A0A9E7TKM2_9EURY|nr:sugar phosphate isomerase/epimerase family protein [Methanoplanus endosymbiosus]UUX92775.1 sugar phosphate isomerase/epimerase [Methanoplanus endosymbiosus]
MFFHEFRAEEIFESARDAGCTSIEFWLETPDFWLNGMDTDKLRRIAGNFPVLLPFTIHAPVLDLNPCSVNPFIVEASIKSSVLALKTAEICGAEIITIHPGRRTAKRPAGRRDYEKFQNYIGIVREESRNLKVKVCIENMEYKVNSLFHHPEMIHRLLKEEEWLYFTLDTAHALASGERLLDRFIDLNFDRIVNIHLSTIENSRRHLPASGDAKISDFLKKISDLGYDGHITLEIEDLNFPDKLSIEEKTEIISSEIKYVSSFFR